MMNLTKAKKTFVPLRRLQRAISRYLCIGHSGSLKTTRNNFLPRSVYLLYNFYGVTMT